MSARSPPKTLNPQPTRQTGQRAPAHSLTLTRPYHHHPLATRRRVGDRRASCALPYPTRPSLARCIPRRTRVGTTPRSRATRHAYPAAPPAAEQGPPPLVRAQPYLTRLSAPQRPLPARGRTPPRPTLPADGQGPPLLGLAWPQPYPPTAPPSGAAILGYAPSAARPRGGRPQGLHHCAA